MKVSITKRFTFEAAHVLPWHKGKCARPHGHSYILDVTVTGEVRPDTEGDEQAGMVLDFDAIKEATKPLIDNFLDHHNLNVLLDNPTAENLLTKVILPVLSGRLEGLTRLRLYETATGWVEWSKDA